MIGVKLSVGGNDDRLFNQMSTCKMYGDFMPKPVTTLHTCFGYKQKSAQNVGDVMGGRIDHISKASHGFDNV